MARRLIALTLIVAVAGCAGVRESRLNPFNWFGDAEPVEATPVIEAPRINDGRVPVQQVTELRIEQIPAGAIVHATGLPPRQGYFNVALVPVNQDIVQNSVLVLQLRASPPLTDTRTGTEQSRELITGLFVSEQALQGITQIQVLAEANALAVRR